jgi:hypothetical protein
MQFRETVAVYCQNQTRHIIYIKVYGNPIPTSQETHYGTVTEPNRLMLFSETVAVCCQNQNQSQSQSHITTDGQSVSMSWCLAQSGTFDQRFYFFKGNVLSLWGAFSDERSGQSVVSLC